MAKKTYRELLEEKGYRSTTESDSVAAREQAKMKPTYSELVQRQQERYKRAYGIEQIKYVHNYNKMLGNQASTSATEFNKKYSDVLKAGSEGSYVSPASYDDIIRTARANLEGAHAASKQYQYQNKIPGLNDSFAEFRTQWREMEEAAKEQKAYFAQFKDKEEYDNYKLYGDKTPEELLQIINDERINKPSQEAPDASKPASNNRPIHGRHIASATVSDAPIGFGSNGFIDLGAVKEDTSLSDADRERMEFAQRDKNAEAERQRISTDLRKTQREELVSKYNQAMDRLYSGDIATDAEYEAQKAIAKQLESQLYAFDNLKRNSPYTAAQPMNVPVHSPAPTATPSPTATTPPVPQPTGPSVIRPEELTPDGQRAQQYYWNKFSQGANEQARYFEQQAKDIQNQRGEIEAEIKSVSKYSDPNTVTSKGNLIDVTAQAATKRTEILDARTKAAILAVDEKYAPMYANGQKPGAQVDAAYQSERHAAEYTGEWNKLNGLEKTGVWLGDRLERAGRSIVGEFEAAGRSWLNAAGLGDDSWAKYNQEAISAITQNMAAQDKTLGIMGDVSKYGGQMFEEALKTIPTILLAFATKGLSLFASALPTIGTAGASFAARLLPGVIGMLKNPAFTYSFARAYGGYYQEEHDANGRSVFDSIGIAIMKAIPNALVEMGSGAETGFAGGLWRSAFGETGEEAAQLILEKADSYARSGKGLNIGLDDIVSWDNPKAIIPGKGLIEAGALGFGTSMMAGGAQSAASAILNPVIESRYFGYLGKNKSNPTPLSAAEQIAKIEAEIAKKESEAYESAARERMDFETRDSDAGKKYAELVKLVNEFFPEDSETKAKIAESVTIDTKRMTEIATNAMQELRARMQAEPTPETLKLSETLTQTVEGIFAGMQTDRTVITDKYTAGLDESVKSEIKGKTGDEAVAYAKGYGTAHALGQLGVSNDTISKATGFEDAQKAADEGRAKWDIDLPKAKAKAAELRKTLPVPGKGGVTYHSSVKQDALTTGQRDQIALLDQVAKPMGYKFVMVEFEKDAAGNYVTDKGKIAPNGYFRDTDGTIYIDVNAGKTAGRMVEDTIIPQTAGHEMTHYLKANAPELFRAYGAAVIDELVAKGQDINALIAQKIGRAKQAGIGVDAAVEEVIADASSMMLQNTQAVQKMAETNPGLFQKITEWVKDFIERVRKAFSKVEGTPEAKALMTMRDGVMKYADSLQKMWDDMAVSVAQAKLDEKPAVVARRDVQTVAKEAAGKKTAYTSDGQAVDYHYEIVPVGSLIPSNLETSLEPNPDYPQELQPRDRTRASYRQQVEDIANKLNPAWLGESANVLHGAPFIGPDMVVESGNGRVLAITRAMRQGKAMNYTQWLKDNAGRFGLDPAKIDNASVLVRVRDSEVNRTEFVQTANEDTTATYSDSESAAADAKKVTPAMLEMANMDSGDINSAGNSSFIASFISKVVPVAERGRMMDASGKLSKSGENRVRTALFQMAYEDGYLTEQMAEASDDTSKNILKAMTAVAPRLALMNDAMKKGTLSDYPIGQAIAEAYRIVQRQKRLGVSVDRYINQQSLVRQDTPAHWMLLEMFNENRNAPNRMTDALNSILNAAERQGNPNQMLMPGLEAERPSVEGIVREGLNRYAEEGMAASERYQERDSDDAPLTAEQIEYFKDSKVRDAQGRLLKVYHGTTREFTEFKTNVPGQTIKDTIGSHFGTEKAASDRLSVVGKEKSPYGENKPSVMSVFLNITNPLLKRDGSVMTESELNAYLKRVGKKLNIPERELGNSSQFSRVPSYVGETIQTHLREQGYNGIPYVNSWEDRGNISYIAFSPEQIKSTTNLTPTSSPDIRYQERDASYLAAVESGDMDAAQKMVDEAAKAAGYTIRAYHGTEAQFNAFDKNTIADGTGYGRKNVVGGLGFYFTNDQAMAKSYANGPTAKNPRTISAYLKIDNPLEVKGEGWGSAINQVDRRESELRRWAKEGGHDGIIVESTDEILVDEKGNEFIDVVYVVFSPDQIKLSDPVTYDDAGNPIPLSQRFTDSNDIRYQERDPVPPMYSKMAQEIEAYKGDKMGTDSVVKYLTGRGVKADEIRWSGIVPFLQGKKSVSKAELLEFAKVSALRVVDWERGVDYTNDEMAARREVNRQYDNVIDDVREAVNKDSIFGKESETTRTRVAFDLLNEISDGKETPAIRDLLPTLSEETKNKIKDFKAAKDNFDLIMKKQQSPSYGQYKAPGGTNYREILFTVPDLDGTFQSAHWSEKNVLAHTRLQDFQTTDGKPVLFIEEVQSDWHEKGREEGYKEYDNKELDDQIKAAQTAAHEASYKYKSAAEALQNKRNALNAQYQGLSIPSNLWNEFTAERNEVNALMEQSDKASKAAMELMDKRDQLIAADYNKVSPAPFATTWHEYVLKRVLRMAADGGYDYVGWTTGQMQLDRYPLEKHVDHISIAKMGTGKYLVDIYDKSKSNIFGEENVTPARLAEVVGKEVARHVIEQAEQNNGRMTNVPGDGLTMGGEGMRNFYDIGGKSSQNIPRFLNKYGAQWGAKIQTIDMQGAENTYQVPAIEVTDAMKESVLFEGQALYQERDPDYRTKRDILAGAFDSVAETEVEKRNLKEYKNMIGSLNRMEEEARVLRQANTAEWKKAEPDRAKVNENKKRIFEIEKRIFSMDKKLIQMQNAAPLRNVLIRQKKAYERKAVEKYKGKRDTNELNDALDLRADRAAKRLMKYALTPDKNSHVPDGMRTDITNLLTALDLASEDKAGNVRDSYRARSWQEALTALGIRMKNADMVAATTKGNDEAGPALLVDPALQDKIESLIKRNDGVVRYRNLKTKEKQTVVEILESVSVAVSEANKKFSADRTKTISDVADKTIDYAKAQREKKLRGEIAERLSTFLNIDMADAFTFFDSLGEGGQEILKGLYNEGFSKLVRNTEDARAFFDGLNTKYGKYGMSTWGGKNATPKNFKVASGTLTMTPAQVMELYMLNKREQARGHIYGQGIRVERIRSRKPGKAAVLWQKDALTVTPAEIEAITSTLTEQQKQVAEEFGAFFGRTSTKWGNEVSMTLYGYYKFIEQNYYPIHSDTNFTMTQDPNSADMLYALLNIGATKDTVKFANNPIIISDIFDTVTRHITDMANYNAFAPALVDAMKWFNYKRIVKDEAGNMRLESVKGGIERMMGAAGKNYVINLLKAVNGIKNPQVASGFAGMVNSAIGKFKTSAVGANARVVLQQHASYVRGSVLLSPAAMTAAYFRSPRRGMQMARKYSAIAAWKHMGYFDMNIGRQMSDLISGNESAAEKIRQAAMKPAGLADDFTIGVLWNAAEIELGKTYKGDKRSEDFYKLVGEKLTEVIDKTQVVDTVFHRSQIMRDKDGLTKIATNFMSEPIKTYNLLMSAVKTGDLKTIARTGTVALLSYVVVAMAAGFSDAARDKDKEKGWQGYWESWMKNVVGIGGSFFESNVWDNMNPLNMIPFGKDVYGLATGYSPSRPDLQAAQRMIWAANDWMKLFKGENKDLYKLIYNTANAISTASGVPISNVMRDVKSIYDTLDPRVVVGDEVKVTYQRFADALANDEEEKALAYYNALIDSGRDSVTIRTQAMQRYKDEETVIAASEAKKAGDYAAYEKAIDQAVKDGIPRDMAIKAADGLSTEKAEKTKPERAKTIDEVKKAMDYKDTYTYESNDLMTVIEKGDNVTAKKIIDKMLKEGRKKDAISGSISTHFKPIYLEAYKKGRASNLKANLLTMYALLGYDRNDKSKDIDAWLKQK